MMFGLFAIASIICTGVQAIKEACEPTIPAENWANKELYHKDLMNGVPMEQIMKNVKNGKYVVTEVYPEPHKNERGQIIIENSKLYYDDIKNYGALQAQQWVKQGKYNLSPEELKKQQEEYEKKMEYLYSLMK